MAQQHRQPLRVSSRWKRYIVPCIIVGAYLLLHLVNLTQLPVFADEAIYIRWSQLIMDDWQQYLFFPLNDGKTPLMIWLMVPFQYLFRNPLFAGRMVSVLSGLGQMIITALIIKTYGGSRKTAWLGMALTAVLPYWYFHHRMALMDGLLTLWMSATYLGASKIVQSFDNPTQSNSKHSKSEVKSRHTLRKRISWTVFTGASLGLALWSKLPALLIIPTLPLTLFLRQKNQVEDTQTSWRQRLEPLIWIAGGVFVGGLFFLTLKLHPAFPQLFGRGSDFLFPWQQVLLEGEWQQTIRNIPTYIHYFSRYLTWPILLLVIFGLFSPWSHSRRNHHILFWSAIIFSGPIALLGRVVYPRYFLPAAIFLTISAALAIQDIVRYYLNHDTLNWKRLLMTIVLTLLLANMSTLASQFVVYALTNPAKIPFVSADRTQYLQEWSAGYGIQEAMQYVQEQADTHTVAVATEGSFGTLPDAALMYLHDQNVDNIYVEGIGYPVTHLTSQFTDRATTFDQVLLLVNSDRLLFELDSARLIQQWCKPYQAPCLQLWDITDQIPLLPQQ